MLGAIRTRTGEIVNTQVKINEVFTDYYRELYAAPRQWAEDRIQLQQLSAEDNIELGGPITPEEIEGLLRTW